MERATGRSRHARRPWLLVFIRGTWPAVMRDETNDPPGAAALGHAVVIAGFVPPRDQRAGSARALASNDIETPLGFAMRSSSDVARARPSDPSHVTRRSRSRHPRSSSSRIFVRGPRSRSPALARPARRARKCRAPCKGPPGRASAGTKGDDEHDDRIDERLPLQELPLRDRGDGPEEGRGMSLRLGLRLRAGLRVRLRVQVQRERVTSSVAARG